MEQSATRKNVTMPGCVASASVSGSASGRACLHTNQSVGVTCTSPRPDSNAIFLICTDAF